METVRSRFWRQFRREARERGAVLYDHKPGQEWDSNRHVGERPRYFAHYVYHLYRRHADVSLEIHGREGDVADTNRVFALLRSARPQIERAFGAPLIWEERLESDVSFIRCRLQRGGLAEEANWANTQREMLEAMERLMGALRPWIEVIPPAHGRD